MTIQDYIDEIAEDAAAAAESEASRRAAQQAQDRKHLLATLKILGLEPPKDDENYLFELPGYGTPFALFVDNSALKIQSGKTLHVTEVCPIVLASARIREHFKATIETLLEYDA